LKKTNYLDRYPKDILTQQLLTCADSIGGKNYFLQLLESIRTTQKHPILDKSCIFRFQYGTIKWTKPIFPEKVSLLKHVRVSKQDGNIFPKKGSKGYKSVFNLLRALKPITFDVQPKNSKDGNGFTFHAFDIIDDKTVQINPLFEVIFFSPVFHVKRFLNPKR
jgi:hypothetical protein